MKEDMTGILQALLADEALQASEADLPRVLEANRHAVKAGAPYRESVRWYTLPDKIGSGFTQPQHRCLTGTTA